MTTIRSTREIDAVFREAKRVAHPLIIGLIRRTPVERGPEGRVAFIAGKRLGNAVIRNRSKRVLRATVQRHSAGWSGFDVVLIARPATAAASAPELDRALDNILKRAGITDA